MNITIRRLSPHDSISELTALLHAAYAQLGALGLNYTAVDQTEDVTLARLKAGECYLALDGGHMVGTIMFRPALETGGCTHYDKPDVASFGQFGVLPSYQRGGIGLRLMVEAEQRARVTGAREIALDTAEGATHLIRWYGRMGYAVVDSAQWEGKTYRSVIMSKTLAAS